MTASSKPRAAVIYNPTKVQRSRLNAAVEQSATDAGWGSTLWYETAADDPGTGMARTALAEGAELVIAVGGDGTVRAVAEGLGDSRVPLAIIPQGTGNVFARNLNIELGNIRSSIWTAFHGDRLPVDIGEAKLLRPSGETSTHRFLIMAGVGLDAEIIDTTSSVQKRYIGWLAYVTAAARALSRSERVRTRVRTEAQQVLVRAYSVVICNCGYMPGNVWLLPDAMINDGILDTLVIAPRRLSEWLGIGQRIIIEHPLERSKLGAALVAFGIPNRKFNTLHYLRGESTEVLTQRTRHCELDGDLFGTVTGIRARALSGALEVVVPTGSSPSFEHDAADTTSESNAKRRRRLRREQRRAIRASKPSKSNKTSNQ